MTPGVTLIGHISHDIVRMPGVPERRQPGGAVYYAGMALRALGAPVTVITRLAGPDEDALITPLRDAGASVVALPSAQTTCFINIYASGGNARMQQLTAQAGPFDAQDVPPVETGAVYFAPLSCGEISAALIGQIVSRANRLIALDAQGMVRQADRGKIALKDWPEKNEILPLVTILKADVDEAAILTGQLDPAMAARRLCGLGVEHALVTGGINGAIICHRGALWRIPAVGQSWPVIDATGCGDTFLAAYLFRIMAGDTAPVAGRFAAAAAALKLTGFGPLQADLASVSRLAGDFPKSFNA